MQYQKCNTPGCYSVWVDSFSLGTGKCPMCLYKQKKAELQAEAAPFAELTPADPVLVAIGRAFDKAIDLAAV